jgi:hypothetical protein
MTMWHNVSGKLEPKQGQLLDYDQLAQLVRAQAEEICKRLKQNPEPTYRGMRVRLLLEKIE